MKLPAVQRETWLVLLTFLHMWIGSSNGCLYPGGDYAFKLKLDKNVIHALAGCAQIPCAYSAPMRTHSGQLVWFSGSPDFPISPREMERKDGLLRPLASILEECSIVLWDFSGHERVEEYGVMLEWGTNETHVYDERVAVSYSAAKLNISLHTEVLEAGKRTIIVCSLPDLCLNSDPIVTWKGLNSKQLRRLRFPREMETYLMYSEQLFYTPVPEDHQAEITCEATFGKNLSTSATMTLTVHSHPQILNSSTCSLKQDLLTCVCVSQGVPLPDVHWPLQNNIEFNTVVTSDGHITVRSTFTMTVVDLTSISSPVCVSRNPLGQTNMTLPLNTDEVIEEAQGDGQSKNDLEN